MTHPMTQRDELLPCPFCGGQAEIVEGDESAYVQCLDVKMHRALWFTGDNNAANEVAEQWNRRLAASRSDGTVREALEIARNFCTDERRNQMRNGIGSILSAEKAMEITANAIAKEIAALAQTEGGKPRCQRCDGDQFISVHENLPDEPCPVCNSNAPSGAERVRASEATPAPAEPSHIMCIGWETIRRLQSGEAVWFDDLQCGAVAADDLLQPAPTDDAAVDVEAVKRIIIGDTYDDVRDFALSHGPYQKYRDQYTDAHQKAERILTLLITTNASSETEGGK